MGFSQRYDFNYSAESLSTFWTNLTVSVVSWSEFLAADPEVQGSILGAAIFSE
jgi:hypothetical protein